MKKSRWLFLMVSLLTCLSASGWAAQEPVKLVIWGGVPEDKGPKQVCDNYNKLNPKVQVEYVRYINNDEGNVRMDMALLAGEKIDIFINYRSDHRQKRINSNLTADISQLCKKNGINPAQDFGAAGAQAVTPDGKIYYLPTVQMRTMILCNKKLFDEAKVPLPKSGWTWDELRATAKKLTKGEGPNKVYGFLISPDSLLIDIYMESKHNRDSWLNQDATATVWQKNPDFKKGFQFFYEMMYTDQTMMKWEDMIVQKVSANEHIPFLNGRVAMVWTGTHQIRNIKDTKTYPRDFITAFAPAPRNAKDQKEVYASCTTMDDFCVNSKSKYKEEAVKFIKWYYTKGFDPMLVNGRIPLYTKYNKTKALELINSGVTNVLDGKSLQGTIFEPIKTMSSNGSDKGRAEIRKIITEETESFFLKQKSLDGILESLQSRCNEVLKNAK